MLRTVNLGFKCRTIVIYHSLQQKWDIAQRVQALTLLGMGMKIVEVGHILQRSIIQPPGMQSLAPQLAVYFQPPEIRFQPTAFTCNIIIFQPAAMYFIF